MGNVSSNVDENVVINSNIVNNENKPNILDNGEPQVIDTNELENSKTGKEIIDDILNAVQDTSTTIIDVKKVIEETSNGIINKNDDVKVIDDLRELKEDGKVIINDVEDIKDIIVDDIKYVKEAVVKKIKSIHKSEVHDEVHEEEDKSQDKSEDRSEIYEDTIQSQPLKDIEYDNIDNDDKLNDYVSLLNIIYYNYSNQKTSILDNINKSYINNSNVPINNELIEIAEHVHNYSLTLVKKYITHSAIIDDLKNNNVLSIIKDIENIKTNNLENNLETSQTLNKNNRTKVSYYNNIIKNTNINNFKTKDNAYDYLWLYYSYLSALCEENAYKASKYKNKNINSYYKYFNKLNSKLYRQTRELISKNSNRTLDSIIDIITQYCSNKKLEVYNKINNFNNIITCGRY